MTEREILDALHRRFCRVNDFGVRRYVVAEHCPLEPLFPRRVLDFVTFDTWGSTGYALDGYEVKTSRSDLQRELRNPQKAEAFMAHLTTFSLVLSTDVTTTNLSIPEQWGIMRVNEFGAVSVQRKPTRLVPNDHRYGMAAAVERPVAAGFVRAAQKTAMRVCSRETVDEKGRTILGT